jgi:hypothetical protein
MTSRGRPPQPGFKQALSSRLAQARDALLRTRFGELVRRPVLEGTIEDRFDAGAFAQQSP